MVKVRFGGDFNYPNAETESAAAAGSEEGHNLLLVAGGVGANPIASVLKHFARRKGENVNWKLLRSSKHIFYRCSIGIVHSNYTFCKKGNTGLA